MISKEKPALAVLLSYHLFALTKRQKALKSPNSLNNSLKKGMIAKSIFLKGHQRDEVLNEIQRCHSYSGLY
ncbi:predicted protein [Enterococcus gallinarum EG2]|nr:predicted protein [Enterococcus gallinarum EG2]